MRLASLLSLALCAAQGASCLNVLIGNDDSWGTANIRALYLAVKAAGHQALIAAPAMQQSGTDGLRFPPTKLAKKGAFGLIDAGAPAEGHEKDDDHIWYINSTPASSIEYGLDHLATKYFGGPPDLVLTGVNQGRNVGLAYLVSGTYGAAKYAVENGIPAIAFSTENSTERVYTSLQPGLQDQANVYAQMAVNLVQQLGDDPKNLLPSKTGLNVNFPSASSYHCQPKSSKWIITRILGTLDSDPVSKAVCMAQALLTSVCYLTQDACACNASASSRCKLPTEEDVAGLKNCTNSISVFEPGLGPDAPPAKQAVVIDKLRSFTECLSA